MPEDTDEPTERLEPIAYLSRSEYRVQVLEALTDTVPKPGQEPPGYDPRELRGVTGASEATLSRILNEFDTRGWAKRTSDGEYVATAQGQHLAVQFGPLVESVETIQKLGDDVAKIPASDLTIGSTRDVYSLAEFDEVTVHRQGAFDQMTVGKYLGNLTRESSRHLSMGFTAPDEEYNKAVAEGLEEGENPFDEAVYAGPLIDWYGEDTSPTRAQVKELLESTTWELYRYEGYMPCQLFIFDETVVIENSQAETITIGTFLESQNDTVRAWALDVFESYKEQSEQVSPEDLSD